MNTDIETSAVMGDKLRSEEKAEALLNTLDAETRNYLKNLRGNGERGGLIGTDFYEVFDILFEKLGKVPTQVLASKATGCSFTTLGPPLRTWKANHGNRVHKEEEKEIAPIPEELAQVTAELITNAVQQIGSKIWEASAAFHSKAIEAERQVMQGKLAEAEGAISEANQTSDAINEELTEAVAKNEQTAALLEAKQKRVVELTDQVDTLKGEVASEQGRSQEIERERAEERAENARLNGALSHSEAENGRLTALLQAAELRLAESTATAKQMREEAEKRLADLRENFDRERNKATADLQAAEQRERKALTEIDSLKKEKAEFKRAIDAGRERAERDVAEAKAEAKRALAEQASMFEDRLNSAKAEAAAAQKTVAALTEQIAMLKKQAEKPKADKKPAENTAEKQLPQE